MNTTAMYPGTFDPITRGHVDVIERASKMFSSVIVVVAKNSKKTPLFTEEERLNMALESLAHLNNVSVVLHQGLVVDFAREHFISAIIRGVRAVSDFEYEFQIALMNRKLEPEVSTIFLMPHEKYTYLNSSIVRELARYGQVLDDMVPPPVANALRLRFKQD
jgi:pantetheine-phosphate adenylyltransferase